jgi:hypothetical protein
LLNSDSVLFPVVVGKTNFTRIKDIEARGGASNEFVYDMRGEDMIVENCMGKSVHTSGRLLDGQTAVGLKLYKVSGYTTVAALFGIRIPGVGSVAVNCVVKGPFGSSYKFQTYINCISIDPTSQTFDTAGSVQSCQDNQGGGGGSTNVTLGQLAFVDADNGNFHVGDDSVALDAGQDESSRFTRDIDNQIIVDWPTGVDCVIIPLNRRPTWAKAPVVVPSATRPKIKQKKLKS